MNLIVKSRKGAVAGNGICDPHIIISIFTPGDDPPQPAQNKYTRQIIQFAFDDLDTSPGPATRLALGNPILFGDEEARAIAERVEAWRQKGIDTVVCHCDAGISRSVGVAAAIAKHYNDDDSSFFNPPNGVAYHPNMLVYKKVLNALYEAQKPRQARP